MIFHRLKIPEKVNLVGTLSLITVIPRYKINSCFMPMKMLLSLSVGIIPFYLKPGITAHAPLVDTGFYRFIMI
jgi:hypothetical protein